MLSEESVATVKRLFPREKVGGLTIVALCDGHEQMRVALEKLAEDIDRIKTVARDFRIGEGSMRITVETLTTWLNIARLEEEQDAEVG